MDLKLSGRTCLVSGASSGIGARHLFMRFFGIKTKITERAFMESIILY
ncbi:hypothetical protein ACMCNP_08420 [Candidatus Acidulodesulfobacterium sp. H_13]